MKYFQQIVSVLSVTELNNGSGVESMLDSVLVLKVWLMARCNCEVGGKAGEDVAGG